MTMLTAERLRELLHYDPETGVFTWLVSRSNVKAGDIAGSYLCRGKVYRRIRVDSDNYIAHRLAFLYITGECPPNEIDHRNMIKDDNRWDNLRMATGTQNKWNRRAYANNTSGFKGVSWQPLARKWVAQIGIGMKGQQTYLGLFDSREEAHAAYSIAAQTHHGEVAKVA